MQRAYSDVITSVKVMIDGLKESKDSLPLGVTQDSISKLENFYNEVIRLNSEQEALKAQLKAKTEAMNKERDAMEKLQSDIKKRIKLDVEQSLWRTFGIEDKK